jgi:hypothetical protein
MPVTCMKIVGEADKDEEVARIDDISRDRRPVGKQSQWYDRVGGKFPFVDDENTKDGDAEHDEADDGGGRPRICDVSKL